MRPTHPNSGAATTPQHDEAPTSTEAWTHHQEGQPPITAARITSVEGPTPPPGGFLSWDDYMAAAETIDDRWEAASRQRAADYDANHHLSLRISKAMRLAPNATVFAALLNGQPVPHEAMDPEWLRRYA